MIPISDTDINVQSSKWMSNSVVSVFYSATSMPNSVIPISKSDYQCTIAGNECPIE